MGRRKKKAALRHSKDERHKFAIRHAFVVGLWAFLLAAPLGILSQAFLTKIPNIALATGVLLLVIAIGVVFDVIGVAVTAAQEAPLHARASRRIFGARTAAELVRRAHAVASFCNDVVGDVTGTLSGALAIGIVFQLFSDLTPREALFATTALSSLVAALIVGGKAYGKVFAMRSSTEIVFQVGRIVEAADHIKRWMIPGLRPSR